MGMKVWSKWEYFKVAYDHHGHFCTNMESTVLLPPVVSKIIGLNCFELFF